MSEPRFEVWCASVSGETGTARALEHATRDFVSAERYAEQLKRELGGEYLIADRFLLADNAACSRANADAARVWHSWEVTTPLGFGQSRSKRASHPPTLGAHVRS